MKVASWSFVIAGVFVSSVAATYAESDGLRSTLAERYATMKAAMASRNADAIAAIFTPDAVNIDSSCHAENRDQMANEVAALPADPNKRSETIIVSVKRQGDTATVAQQYNMHTIKVGQDGLAKNVHLHAESTDTWVLIHSRWLAKRSVTNLMDYRINGVTIAHKVRPNPCL